MTKAVRSAASKVAKMLPEVRAATSARMIERFSDPLERAAQSERAAAGWTDDRRITLFWQRYEMGRPCVA